MAAQGNPGSLCQASPLLAQEMWAMRSEIKKLLSVTRGPAVRDFLREENSQSPVSCACTNVNKQWVSTHKRAVGALGLRIPTHISAFSCPVRKPEKPTKMVLASSALLQPKWEWLHKTQCSLPAMSYCRDGHECLQWHIVGLNSLALILFTFVDLKCMFLYPNWHVNFWCLLWPNLVLETQYKYISYFTVPCVRSVTLVSWAQTKVSAGQGPFWRC
jgi:hypothetical protein